MLLVDRVPEPELRGDAVVEPMEYRQSITALRCSSETQQLGWIQVVEEPHIGRRGRMVKLVDDDHVEVVGAQVVQVGRVQALNRGKDVLEVPWTSPAHPLLPE